MSVVRPDAAPRRKLVASAVLAILIAALLYRINRAFGDFLADEGYLWYGVQRVLAGQVPIRDFMSYEVGRYYLSALLMYPFGNDGLLALRAVLGVVAALSLGVSTALAGMHDRRSRVWQLLPAAALFALWLVPRHKAFDIAISAVLVMGVYRLMQKPAVARYFQLGVIVGIAADIGQNHGLYALVASGLAVGILLAGRCGAVTLRGLLAWAIGVVAGYLPVMLTALFARGYLQAEIDALHYLLFQYKGTNLPLPVPWPWRLGAYPPGQALSHVLVSLFFLALPVGLLAGLVAIARRMRQGVKPHQALFVAAWTVAVPYANVAFSRADVAHLAQAIVPFLLLALATPALLGWRPRWQPLVAAGLLLLSLPVALPLQPRMPQWRGRHLVPASVHGDRVMVSTSTRKLLQLAETEHAHGTVLAMPFYPGLMAALGETSPIWEIYPLFPRTPAFEESEIARLQAAPPFAILLSPQPRGRGNTLGYPQTHPLTDAWIRAHYRRQASGLPRVVLYLKRSAAAP